MSTYRKTYRKPDGKLTTNYDAYSRAWTRLIGKFEDATGTHINAFDPSLSGYDRGDMNASFQIPLWLAKRIIQGKGKS